MVDLCLFGMIIGTLWVFGPRIIYDAASVEDAKVADNDDTEARKKFTTKSFIGTKYQNSPLNRLLAQNITTKIQFYL